MGTASTSEQPSSYLSMRLMDGHYEMVEDGYTDPEPILHLFCRGEDMQKHHVTVEGFYPYFYVEMQEALEKSEALSNDHRVRKVETVDKDGGGFEGIGDDGEWKRLAKIYTIAPYEVKQLRENFETTWEADVRFVDRFCYDMEIVDSFAVPTRVRTADDSRITPDEIDVDGVECDVDPRVCYLDIEVRQSDDGISVVSERGKELAEQPITAISTYDNYTRRYKAFVLEHEVWAESEHDAVDDVASSVDVSVDVTTFDTERELLSAFARYMRDNAFDVATAWNASFDFPYLINRYLTLKHNDVYYLSPTGGIDDDGLDGSGRWMNGDVEGLLLFDLLDGYEKSQIHELEDSRLETVAAHETDIEKLSLDEGIDDAWVNEPSEFVRYSIRDVEAMVEIDNNRGVLV